MNLKRIFVPGNVAKQLEALPADTRLHLEVYLGNLDVLMASAPRHYLVSRLVRCEDGFMGTVDDATIFFTVDIGLRTAFIRRIDLHPPDPGPERL